MASSDLLTELGKDTFKLDSDSEKRLTQMLLKLLEDRSGDVQGMAVKWYGDGASFSTLSSLQYRPAHQEGQ